MGEVMKVNTEYRKWLKENRYRYFVDCREKNTNNKWRKVKISNKYFYDTFYAHNLINELKTYTGYGVILDTSFNIHGKTIVMSPQDALDDFFSCGLDSLMIEDYLVMKK